MNRLLFLFLAATSAWAQDQSSKDASVRYIQEKLQTIIIPEIEFDETPFADAIDFLRAKSQELDPEPDPTRRGMSVIIRGPFRRPGFAPYGGFDDPNPSEIPEIGEPDLPKITLHRKNISLDEAFRTLTEMGGFQFRIEPFALVVEPLPNLRAKANAENLPPAP